MCWPGLSPMIFPQCFFHVKSWPLASWRYYCLFSLFCIPNVQTWKGKRGIFVSIILGLCAVCTTFRVGHWCPLWCTLSSCFVSTGFDLGQHFLKLFWPSFFNPTKWYQSLAPLEIMDSTWDVKIRKQAVALEINKFGGSLLSCGNMAGMTWGGLWLVGARDQESRDLMWWQRAKMREGKAKVVRAEAAAHLGQRWLPWHRLPKVQQLAW